MKFLICLHNSKHAILQDKQKDVKMVAVFIIR